MHRDEINEAVYAAIDEINQFRPKEERLEKSPDTPLMGGNGKLDSLALVNFIVASEMNVEERTGVSVNLGDEKAMAEKNSPFRTVGTFTEYISKLLQEKAV